MCLTLTSLGVMGVSYLNIPRVMGVSYLNIPRVMGVTNQVYPVALINIIWVCSTCFSLALQLRIQQKRAQNDEMHIIGLV